MALMLFYVMARLMAPAKPKIAETPEDDRSRVEKFIKFPKDLFLSCHAGRQVIPFQQQRKRLYYVRCRRTELVCMGDPVGKEDEYPELIWRFREAADRYHGWSVFYEVSTTSFPPSLP